MRSITFGLLALVCLAAAAPGRATADAFERITPQQAGYSPEKLAELRAFLETSGSDSLLLLHEGKVFFEWGDIRRKLLVHSIRKALLNGLYGIHHGRGEIDLDATLAELGVQDTPPALSERERSARLRDLLQSRSGVYHAAAAESEGMAQTRPRRGSAAAGERYYYNNWDFNVAGHVLERRTGRRIFDAFAQEIAKPLGMLDYHNRIVVTAPGSRPDDPQADGYYHYERERSRFPAYHFRMSAHDLALYGQLFLQRGHWQGRQLVPAEWIRLSTKPYSIVQAEYGLAYGMLWDVLVPGDEQQQPSFFHTGAGVHMLGVYPEHRLVMVHRVDTERGSPFGDGHLYQVIRRMHAAREPRAVPHHK